MSALDSIDAAFQRLYLDGRHGMADRLDSVRADVAELIEAAGCVVDTTPKSQRENWSCHKGITTAAKCGRCSRDLRLAAALARVQGGQP